MTENNPEKRHELSEQQKEPKSPSPSLPPSFPPKDIFSSKRHSMDYVTVAGVKLRTGYDNIRDWHFLCLKELLDNAVDFLWSNYKGANDAAIDVYIEKKNDSLLCIKIRNTNPRNVEDLTLQRLNLIFDFDMTAGSKQNLHGQAGVGVK